MTERHLSATIQTSGLDYASPDNQSERGYLGISPETWTRVLVITGLFAAVFWPNLRRLWLKTNPFTGEANWSHAVCVPVIGLYYLFIHREDLIKAHSQQFIWGRLLRPGRAIASGVMIVFALAGYFVTENHNSIAFSILRALSVSTGVLGGLVLLLDWSMATMLFGLGMFVYGIYPGQNDYLKDLGMVVTLFGIVLLLCGWNVMKVAWFPIVFLICAIPWPGLVYSWVAEPLSTMAARVAVHVLQATGVDSACSGTKIIIQNPNIMLPPRILNVAEACAGMRSLMTFIAVAGAVAFLSPRPLWQKVIIVVSAIPIAIFCNVMRISGQGLLDHYVSTAWSESFAHQFVGMVMLLPAFFLILGVGLLLDKMFIEEAEESDQGPLISTPISAIATRETAIPALGTMSSIVAATVVQRTAPVVPMPPVTKPIVAAAPKPPAAPALVAPGPMAAAPVKPRAVTPPRPMTAANPPPRSVGIGRPAAIPVNQLNGRSATAKQPIISPISRPIVSRPANRPAPSAPITNSAVTKPKEAP